MNNEKDFVPENEEERLWAEQYNNISIFISEKIKELDKEKRLPYLRESNPSDLQLMNLFLQAKKKEDYETCEAAKALLSERGLEFKG